MAKDKQPRTKLMDAVEREYTIHLHKHVHGKTFKKRAPTAIKAIRQFAQKAMGTKDVRVDPSLNGQVWSRGVRSVPHRIRVRLARRRMEADEDNDASGEEFYTYVSYVPVASFKGLQTISVNEA